MVFGENAAQIRILLTRLQRRLRPDDDPLVLEFARLWWSRIPAEDLEPRDADDDSAATLEAWAALRRREPGATEVAVFNPVPERDGWRSRHTVVRVFAPNMPFVTDSVLMALSHGGLVVHHLNNVVLATERDGDGTLRHLSGDASAPVREVFIFAEIDRLPEDELDETRHRLRAALQDVEATVQDFDAMKARLRDLARDVAMQPAPVSEAEREEALAFLEWLPRNHFTFLGYRAFRYEDGRIRQGAEPALGVLRHRPRATERALADQPEGVRAHLLAPRLLSFGQAGTRSRVHRRAYPEYVGIRRFDTDGRVIGEHGFLGLFTSRVYHTRPDEIPVLRRKVAEIRERSGLDPSGFDGKVLDHVLDTFPRDELFQAGTEELLPVVLGITYIHERRRTRVFVRHDPYGLFVYCLLFMPRDLYNTYARRRVLDLLLESYQARDAEFEPFFSESILVRLQITLRIQPGSTPEVDESALVRRIQELTRDWQADLQTAIVQAFPESRTRDLTRRWAAAFPPGYRDRYPVETAVQDIRCMEALDSRTGLALRFHQRPDDAPGHVRLKVFQRGDFMPLAQGLQTLENLGLSVRSESPHRVERADGVPVCLHDFEVRAAFGIDVRRDQERFAEAFLRIWSGETDDDRFNRLVLAAGLDWRQVSLLRAYARYLKQIRMGFSQSFIARSLYRHPHIARDLVACFEDRFDPRGEGDGADAGARVVQALEGVELLNEERILRRYLELIRGTLRTNYWRRDDADRPRPFIALKLAPERIPDLPRPVPAYEIFVSSPRVEGVHLRGGPIARGGLRWSDRAEDYRTEILGLAKAQKVKNAVIVPTGAKGGFVVRRPAADPEAFRAQGLACYQDFVRGLLDVTDNVVGGRVVPPPAVRRHDGDDPYLVVAADKGTATFSDTANEVAQAYGHWLGDAFASGGTHGYDHKAMGITARGAWISVQRHFEERGVDVQRDPVTVLGIGDMSGDVFGNGMLQSRSLRLLAAFNHRHVFVDPDPDPDVAFEERRRLFTQPSSGWDDYDPAKLSPGGAVFERSAKAVAITPRMRERFELPAGVAHMAPDELIGHLLRAPVDLIWNGGIGTYVKATHESHGDVGDRGNDGLRIDARELRCRVFGEGGNLGMTQAARVEFAGRGGAVNTDFIDNSGGVDCSDHEVNIKIALGVGIERGALDLPTRNRLLHEMTDEVAELVLTNNFRQAQGLSLAERNAAMAPEAFRGFVTRMEEALDLDRELESLPSDEQLADRMARGGNLTRPELAVLLAFAKMHLKAELARDPLPASPLASELVLEPFPRRLVEAHGDLLREHRLHQEITATTLANDVVHHMGIVYAYQLEAFVGASVREIAQAWLVAARCFRLREAFRTVEGLPGVSAEFRLERLRALMRLGRRASRWLLRHERPALGDPGLAPRLGAALDALREQGHALVGDLAAASGAEEAGRLREAGLSEDQVAQLAGAADRATTLSVVQRAQMLGIDPGSLAETFAAVGSRLNLDWLVGELIGLNTRSQWQTMERDALIDDLFTEQARLAGRVHRAGNDVEAWLERHGAFRSAWDRALTAAERNTEPSFALYGVTCRKLMDAVRNLPD